jgi:hypothetical protein
MLNVTWRSIGMGAAIAAVLLIIGVCVLAHLLMLIAADLGDDLFNSLIELEND